MREWARFLSLAVAGAVAYWFLRDGWHVTAAIVFVLSVALIYP